jgi:hypothetical protein
MKEEFLKEFKALLEKYDVSINFSVSGCSDTHGLYDEKMVIDHKDKIWFEVNGWCIDACELKDLK